MPTIEFDGRRIECLEGSNLRSVLMRARLPLYSEVARAVHCRGLGSCGTCAVRIEGPVSDVKTRERMRLGFPPHDRSSGLRLACQTNVLGDIKVTKYRGLWGHKTQEDPVA